MAQLGSIYETHPNGPRGPDLHHTVRVPPEAVGHAGGCRIRVPRELPGGGQRHRRVKAPGERGAAGEELTVQLPVGMPDGAILRLRGQGAPAEGGHPGDLMITVQLGTAGDDSYLGLVEAPRGAAGDNATLYVAAAIGLAMVGALLAALMMQGCSCNGAGDTDTDGPDPDAGYHEVDLTAPQAFLDRQAEYLAYCDENSGPDLGGGITGQVCRVAMGHEVDPDPIYEGTDKCSDRLDCADFKVASLVRMLYLDDETGALDDDLRAHIEQSLLDFKYWLDEPGVDQMCFWTENHQILYHSGELLVGQRFPDEVFTNNGMTGAEHVAHALPLVERWLDLRGGYGFSEWHSNVYFNEDIPALVNLADFAEDPVIRAKAAAVLDIVAFDLLNNMYKGHFATVHGRTYESKFIDGLVDSTDEAAWIMVGLGEYRSVSDFSGSFLATSPGYFTPAILEAIADATAQRHEHKQRDSWDVAEGPELGVGYESHEDVVVWAGLSALVAPEVIEGTFGMVEDLDLWEGFLFGDIPDEIMMLIDMAIANETLPDLATQLEPVSRGICLEAMDTYVWRTPHYQLAGGQDYNPATWASQTQMWLATLDGEAYVFTSYPSDLADGDLGVELAGEWIGSWLPRATFHENVGVIQYRTQEVPIADAYISSDHTHAFFPREGFDEVVQDGHWTFGRKGEGYVALWSQNPVTWNDENSYELDAEGAENIWVVELGSSEEWASFEDFVAAVAAAEIGVSDGLSYGSPSQGLVQVGWEGPMTVDGSEVDIGPYQRWDNDYAEVERGASITRIDLDDQRLVLDFETGERRLLQRD
jgi:hypothetical protein